MNRITCFTLAGVMLLLLGCSDTRLTHPRRTATEIYLLSTAVERALKPLSGEMLRGRLVFLDDKFVPSDDDHKYLTATSRAKLLAGGARLTSTRDEAEIIVEVRTPGVGIDHTKFLVGIPGLPIGQLMTAAGIPAGTVSTPELALVRNEKQWGTAGAAYVAYWRDTGEVIASSGPHIGRSYREDWTIFGFSKTISNIPPSQPPEAHEASVLPEQPDAAGPVAPDAAPPADRDTDAGALPKRTSPPAPGDDS